MEQLEQVYRELEKNKIRFNRDETTSWLFEYACCLADYQQVRASDSFIRETMLLQAKIMLEEARKKSKDSKNLLNLTLIPYKEIPSKIEKLFSKK